MNYVNKLIHIEAFEGKPLQVTFRTQSMVDGVLTTTERSSQPISPPSLHQLIDEFLG